MRTILVRHRVLVRDSRSRYPVLPDRFYGSIVAYLVGDIAPEEVESHIFDALKHHGFQVSSTRISTAVAELIEATQCWDRRPFTARNEAIVRVIELDDKEILLFRGMAAKGAASIRYDQRPVIAEYPVFRDGNALHDQLAGWKHAVKLLMQHLMTTIEPVPATSNRSAEFHEEYSAMERRQLAYPFLASWRLVIEVTTKNAVRALSVDSGRALPPAILPALARHELSPLWLELKAQIAAVVPLVGAAASSIGIAPDAPGLDLDPSPHDAVIDTLANVDPDGQALRYVRDRRGALNLKDVHEIDLADMHWKLESFEQYASLVQRFAGIVASLSHSHQVLARLRAGEPLYSILWPS